MWLFHFSPTHCVLTEFITSCFPSQLHLLSISEILISLCHLHPWIEIPVYKAPFCRISCICISIKAHIGNRLEEENKWNLWSNNYIKFAATQQVNENVRTDETSVWGTLDISGELLSPLAADRQMLFSPWTPCILNNGEAKASVTVKYSVRQVLINLLCSRKMQLNSEGMDDSSQNWVLTRGAGCSVFNSIFLHIAPIHNRSHLIMWQLKQPRRSRRWAWALFINCQWTTQATPLCARTVRANHALNLQAYWVRGNPPSVCHSNI